MKIIKRAFTAAATIAVLITLAAGQAGADELTDTCDRALPQFKEQCLAQGAPSAGGVGVGPARGTDPTKYFNGMTPLVYKTDQNGDIVRDRFGAPVIDKFPEPTYGTKPGTDGPQFKGYNYETGKVDK